MKPIFTALVGVLCSLSVWAQSSSNRIVEGVYFPNAQVKKNYVKNATCDKNVNDITASAGSLTVSATNVIKGANSCAINASANAQTYTWSIYAFEQELYGRLCAASFKYYGDASLYKAYVKINSVKVTISDTTLQSNGTNTGNFFQTFPCGTSGVTPQVIVEATGDGAVINVDDVYFGLAPAPAPTVQKFTTANGTYQTPSNPSPAYIEVIMVGGGGGGAGSGTGDGTASVAGTSSTFGTSLLVAGGGLSGFRTAAGAVGGTASLGTGPIGTVMSGGNGCGDFVLPTIANGTQAPGACGGTTPLGFTGGSAHAAAGVTGPTNTGAGGGGAGCGSVNACGTGGGGGGGGYVDAIIFNPSINYAFVVGASGGTAGGAGASGAAGGAGAAGYIEVREIYW